MTGFPSLGCFQLPYRPCMQGPKWWGAAELLYHTGVMVPIKGETGTRCDTAAAPATEDGESARNATGDSGKAVQGVDPRARRPAITPVEPGLYQTG